MNSKANVDEVSRASDGSVADSVPPPYYEVATGSKAGMRIPAGPIIEAWGKFGLGPAPTDIPWQFADRVNVTEDGIGHFENQVDPEKLSVARLVSS